MTGAQNPSLTHGSLSRLHATRLTNAGGSLLQVFALDDGSGDILTIQGGCVQRLDEELRPRWQSRPFGVHWINNVIDLDGDGSLEILCSNGRDVVILSAESGEVLWTFDVTIDTTGDPTSYGTYATMFQVDRLLPGSEGLQVIVPCFSRKEVLILDCSGDVTRSRIHRELYMNDAYHPTITLGDVNADGRTEIVIARLGGVYVFDPVSGTMLTETQWKTDDERRRNYGHFELVDIDSDGALGAVIISDRVTRHIAVLENDGSGNFQPRWDRFVEHIYPNDSTEVRYCYNSVGRFLPSGKQLAISLYNDQNSGKWSTEVLDLMSGSVQWSIDDHILAGIEDIDRDGRLELLLSPAKERGLRPFAGSLAMKAGTSTPLWQLPNTAFASRTIQYRGQRGQFKPDPFSNDSCWLVNDGVIVIDRSDKTVLASVDVSGVFTTLVDELDESARVVHASGSNVIVSTSDGRLTAYTGSGVHHHSTHGYQLLTEAHLSARPGTVPTVEVSDRDTILIIPHSDHASIETYRDGHRVTTTRIDGRGRRAYDDVVHNFPIAHTSLGTRVVASTNVGGHAGVTLYDLEGNAQRVIPVAAYPANDTSSRIGIYDFQYFLHSRGDALYLAAYRSASMNSECSLAVLIETGEVLWQTDRYGQGEHGRGIGPWSLSTVVTIGEKRCVLFCAKDTFVALDLENGEFLRPPTLLTEYTAAAMQKEDKLKEQNFSTWSTIDDPFTSYGSVIAIDVDGDGNEEFVVAGCFGGFGVLDKNFAPLWWKVSPFNDVQYRLPGIADLDGDGRMEFVQSHRSGQLVVYDAATGAQLDSHAVNGIATDVIVCDLDGCGTPEVITSTNTGSVLLFRYVDRKLRLVNEVTFESSLGVPVTADIDSDGKNEILVTDGLGSLHMLRIDG